MKERAEFIAGNLLAALAIVAPFAPKRSTIPILNCVLIEADRSAGAVLTATNLDCQARAPVAAAVDSPSFRVAVMAAHLRSILSLVPRDSVCSITRETIESVSRIKDRAIKSVVERVFLNIAGGRYVLIAAKAEDFYRMVYPDDKPQETLQVEAETFRGRLKRVAAAMSKEETRYYLNGVCLYNFEGRTHFVATDGHRMALAPYNDDAAAKPVGENYILPRWLVGQLLAGKGLLPKAISFAGGFCRIQCEGGVEIISKLIDGAFPTIEAVMKFRVSADIAFAVDVAPLKAALRRISASFAGTGSKGRAVSFSFTRDGLFIFADHSEINGTCERVELADPPGETFTVGFNAAYVLDIVDRIRAGEAGPLRFVLKSPEDPAWFPGETASSVLMPVRVTVGDSAVDDARREIAA